MVLRFRLHPLSREPQPLSGLIDRIFDWIFDCLDRGRPWFNEHPAIFLAKIENQPRRITGSTPNTHTP